MSTKVLVGTPKEIEFHWCGYFKAKTAWRHEERVNWDFELLIGVKGEVFLTIGTEEIVLVPGMMIIIPPQTSFVGTKDSQDLGFYWLHFATKENELVMEESSDYLATSQCWCLPLLTQHLLLDNEIVLIQQLQTVKQEHYANHSLVNAYTYTLLLSISEKFKHLQQTATANNHFLVSYIKHYLQSNFLKPLSIAEVASYFGYNKAYFSNLFSKEVGQTISQYVRTLRLEHARQLLIGTKDSVTTVARKAGFEDEKYFSRVFSRQYGISPQRYRLHKKPVDLV